MAADKSYFNQVSTNLSLTLGTQAKGIGESVSASKEVLSNKNLSATTKAAAVAVNAAETAMQVAGVLGAVDTALESVLLPALGALGLKGLACLPISKQLDPVMGIDIHMVTIPPSPAPIPMPHPYIGVLLRPKDFLSVAAASFLPPPPPPPEMPEVMDDAAQNEATANKAITVVHSVATMVIGMIGATVKIGSFQPRVVAGTPTKNIPHFPMGSGFHPAFAAFKKNQGHAFLGSLFALADGDPISGGGAHLHLNCNDIGIPSVHDVRPSKNTDSEGKPKGVSLYLPTGIITPIPPAKQTITSPIPSPFNPVGLLKKLAGAAFGRLFKKLKKKVSDKLHDAVNKNIKSPKLKKALHKAICTVTGHPVDVASGTFFTDEEDFSLPGPIPLSWERTWYSTSDYQGPLGNGWHHSYDMALSVDEKTGVAAFRMNDGRPAPFMLPMDKPDFNQAEKLELRRNDDGSYYIWDIKEDLFYYFTETEYDGAKRIKSIVNRNGFSIRFDYTHKGHLYQIKDSADRILKIDSDQEGRILTIHAPRPDAPVFTFPIARYEYDEEGNMTKQTNALGDSMLFEYQGRLMTKETWRNGAQWFFKYDGSDIGAKCIHTWGDKDLFNHKLTYLEGQTIVENSLGDKTIYYHKNGLVYLKIDAVGAEYRWQYDEHNNLLSETDPNGNAHLFGYDKRGNQTQSTDPVGATVLTEYANPAHPFFPSQATDAVGGKWKWEYDDAGNLVKRTNPLGTPTNFQYSDGLLNGITDALGFKTQIDYDTHFNLNYIADSKGTVTRYEYDYLGRCTAVINPNGITQKRVFDILGRVTKVFDFDGNEIELEYDALDNVVRYKDKQKEVLYKYEGLWKLVRRTENGTSVRFKYDTEEQLRKITNEKGNDYTFELDAAGNVLKEIGFDDLTRSFERDMAGRVTKVIRPGDKYTEYEYDAAGRVTEVKYSDGTVESYTYRNDGRLMAADNDTAKVAFERDIMGNVLKETSNDYTVESTYDSLGRRVGVTSSLGADLHFELDELDNITAINAAHGSKSWKSKLKYDKLGLEQQRDLPGELQHKWERDGIGRPTNQSVGNLAGAVKHNRKYQWDVNDRLKSITDSVSGTTRFEHDNWGNLSKATYQDGNALWRKPDEVGNLYTTATQKDSNYGNAGQILMRNGIKYKYDLEGNLIEKKGNGEHWRYEWAGNGMLQKVTRPDGGTVTFGYDALGRRVWKQFNGNTTRWVWDGNTPLHEWKERTATSEINHLGITTWVFEEGSFVPAAKLQNETSYSIITDHLGTPTALYDERGEKSWSSDLDIYGKVRSFTGSSLTFCPFRYQGQYHDTETGLYYNRFRYYSPEEGGYISQDPIGLEGGVKLYEYVSDVNSELDVLGLATYHRKNGQFGSKRGRPKKKNTTHGNSVHSKKPRQHYVIEDQDGIPYHGVGDTKGTRAKQSLKRLKKENPGKTFTIQSQTDYTTSMGAVKAEAQGIKDTGGAGANNPNNYNINESPGAPFI